MHLQVVKLDITGQPVDLLSLEAAACEYVKGSVVWTMGDAFARLRGGMSRAGTQSVLDLHPIIAVAGKPDRRGFGSLVPHVTREKVIRRDQGLCLYCGDAFHDRQLTMDHVTPRSRGGAWSYENLVAACKWCNSRKADRTPEEAGMPLLALPYTPNWAEDLILRSRHLVADQMEFLRARAGRNSRLNA